MVKYAMTIYSTMEALETAIEAVDNDISVRPIVSPELGRVRYALVVGGAAGFDGGAL